MTPEASGKEVFRELQRQNPQVAIALRKFRQPEKPKTPADFKNIGAAGRVPGSIVARALSPTLPAASIPAGIHDISSIQSSPASRDGGLLRPIRTAAALLVLGLVVAWLAVGSTVWRFFSLHWRDFLLPAAGLLIGAALVLIASRLDSSPLKGIKPPDPAADDPLKEIKDLAERIASRLRTAYKFQLGAVVVVGVVLVGLIAWTIVMVTQSRLLYATAFGSSSVAMMILTRWKWQPFDRINDARRLADSADISATALRLQLKTIMEIRDPKARLKEQQKAVDKYLALAYAK